MNTEYQHRVHALRSNFELVCIYGLVVIAADFLWLIHDIVENGLSVWYSGVGFLMIIGFIGTIYVVLRHNSKVVRAIKDKISKKEQLILRLIKGKKHVKSLKH